MNLPLFISRRISKESTGSFSSIINRIAIISIALGLAVLILAFMVLYGFQSEIKNKIFSLSGHLIVSKYTLDTSYEESAIVVNDSILSLIMANQRVSQIQPYVMKAGLLKTAEEVQGVIIKGVDETFDTLAFNKNMIRGSFPDFSGEKYSTEVAISQRVSNYLALDTGSSVIIYFIQNPPRYRKLKIVGVYETGLEEFDEKIIIGDMNMIRRINNWPDTLVGGLEVFIKDTNELEEAESELFYDLPGDLYVDKVSDKYIQIFDWLNLLNRNVLVLIVIILFVSCTSIISILLILIMERTQMIGLMKAIGANDGLIRRSFVWNGILLISKGLLFGNIVGVGIGLIQYWFKVIPLDATNYYMSHVPIQIDIPTIMGLNVLVLLVISLTLIIPVQVISKVQPVKAIRFD